MLKRFSTVLLIFAMILCFSSTAFADEEGTEFEPLFLPELYDTTKELLNAPEEGAAILFLDAHFSMLSNNLEITKSAFYEKCYLARSDSIVTAAFKGDDDGNSIFFVFYDLVRNEGQYIFMDIPFSLARSALKQVSDETIYEVNGSDWTEYFIQCIDLLKGDD